MPSFHLYVEAYDPPGHRMKAGWRSLSACSRSGRNIPLWRASARIIETKSTRTEPLPLAEIATCASVSRTADVNANGTSCQSEPLYARGTDAIGFPLELSATNCRWGEPSSGFSHSDPSYLMPASRNTRP